MNLDYGFKGGTIYLNYRGADDVISDYLICDGKGTSLGSLIHSGNIGNYAATSTDISNLNTRIAQLEKDVKRNEPVNQNLKYSGGTSDFHRGSTGTATTLSAPANAKLLKTYCNITAYCKDRSSDPVYSTNWIQGKTLQYANGNSTSYTIAQSDAVQMSVSIDTSLNITLIWTMVGQITGCTLVCDCLCTYTF